MYNKIHWKKKQRISIYYNIIRIDTYNICYVHTCSLANWNQVAIMAGSLE